MSAEAVDTRGTRVAAAVGGGAYAAVLEQPSMVISPWSAAATPLAAPSAAHSRAIIPSAPVDDARGTLSGVWRGRLLGVRSQRELA